MKRLFLPLLILMLLTSCVSTEGASPEVVAVSASGREQAAIMLLGADMAEALGRERIPEEDLAALLPRSYVFYKDYSPSYEALSKAYLEGVDNIIREILAMFRPAVTAAVENLSTNPKAYIDGDDTLTKALLESLDQMVAKTVADEVARHRGELQNLYALSERTFGELRKAYGNLSSVGLSYVLPASEPIRSDVLVNFIHEEFRKELQWNERLLKNTPAQSGTLYTVFWES